jgi:hypothetical protein
MASDLGYLACRQMLSWGTWVDGTAGSDLLGDNVQSNGKVPPKLGSLDKPVIRMPNLFLVALPSMWSCTSSRARRACCSHDRDSLNYLKGWRGIFSKRLSLPCITRWELPPFFPHRFLMVAFLVRNHYLISSKLVLQMNSEMRLQRAIKGTVHIKGALMLVLW